MAKQNAFVKISGNLIEKEEVLEWLKELARQYFVAVCIGGGEQINQAFQERGFKSNFNPLGRVTKTLEERQLARDVLEANQAFIQDMLDEKGISARVIVPVDDVATVLCHVNGDVKVLQAYQGYDKLFILTLKDRVEKKKAWMERLAGVFSESIEKGSLEKIEVVGF